MKNTSASFFLPATVGILVAYFHLTITAAGDTEAPPKMLRVASISFVPKKWDKDANTIHIEKLVTEAAKHDARLIVTPEGALDGYVVNDVIAAQGPEEKARFTQRFQQLAEPLNGPSITRIAKLADRLNVHVILGVLLRHDDNTTFNSSVLLNPHGDVAGVYHKTHFHQGYDVNPAGYTAGDEYPVFDLGPLKMGMMICFDRQLPEPTRLLTLGGANLVVCPAYGGTGDWNTRLMQVRAYENEVYVIFTHPRQSLIIAPDGDLLAQSEGDAVTYYNLDLTKRTRGRQSVRYRRPGTYQSPETNKTRQR